MEGEALSPAHTDETLTSSISDTSSCSSLPKPVKSPDEFTLVIANCEGVTGKKAIIENMLTSFQPDVFLVVESKLDSNIADTESPPPSYRATPAIRYNRTRGGGGVFIAVREGITAEPLPEFNTNCQMGEDSTSLKSPHDSRSLL